MITMPKFFGISFIFFMVLSSGDIMARETQGSGGRAVVAPSKVSSSKAFNHVPDCYSYINEIVKEDPKSSTLGIIKSMHGSCRVGLANENVQKYFADSKTFARFLTKNAYSHLGETNQFDLNRCADEKKVPIHALASKYYYLLNRVNLGQESVASQIGALGRVLGDQSMLDRIGCTTSDFPEVKKICVEVKQCKTLDRPLEKLALKTHQTINQLNSLQDEIRKKSALMRHPRTKYEDRLALYNEVAWLKVQVESVKSSIPWAEGREYKKTLKMKRPISEAIEKQLQEDRRKLIKQYGVLTKHKRCIQSTVVRTDRCDVEDIEDIANNTPTPAEVTLQSKAPNQRTQFAYVNAELRAQQCIFDGKVDQVQTSNVLDGVAIQAVLVGVTMGLGSAAVLGRVLTSRALVAEKTAENFVKVAKASQLGIDGGMFLKDSKEAIDICQQFAAQTPINSKEDSCPLESIYQPSPQVDDYSNCMIAIAFAGLDGGRLSLGKLRSGLAQSKIAQLDEKSQKKLSEFLDAHQARGNIGTLRAASDMDNLTRFKAAEALIGRKLTVSQRQALLDAHEIGRGKGYYEYSLKELRQKAKLLKTAGLSSKEADVIMRTGIAGKFAGDNVKFAQQGILESQMAARNTPENLSSYSVERNSQRFANQAFDKEMNGIRTEIDSIERNLNKPGLSEAEKKVLQEKMTNLEVKREKIFNETINKDRTIDDHMTDTRSSIAKETDRIERLHEGFYGARGLPLDTSNPQLKNFLQNRRELFEREALLSIQKNGGDPTGAIAPFRLSVKDLNQQQNMKFYAKTPAEAQKNILSRALAQDFNGFHPIEVEKLIGGKAAALQNGKPLISGEIRSLKTLPISSQKEVNEDVWNAYVKYSQRKADQQILRDVADNTVLMKKMNIDPKKLDSVEDLYVTARDKAELELKFAIEKLYKNNSKKAVQVMKDLSGQ